MKKNLFVILFSVFFGLLFAEIFIRLFYPQSLADYWKENENEFGLLVNKNDYLFKNHRVKQHVATYRFGSYRNRTTIKNDNLNDLPKILIVGDSFTFGWLLEDEFTYIHKLQMDNLNYHLINSSVAGWGASSYTAFVEIFCKEINPKKIIIFINTDDFYRSTWQKYYLLKNGNLVKNKVQFEKKISITKFDKIIPFYSFLKKNSHSFILLRNVVYNIVYPPQKTDLSEFYYTNPNIKLDPDEIKTITILNKKIFLRLKNLAKKCGSDLLIINNGWAEVINIPETNPNKQFLLGAEYFFKKNNIKYYDLAKTNKLNELYKDPYRFLFKEDLHPNKEGANLIYNASKKIIKNFLEFQ